MLAGKAYRVHDFVEVLIPTYLITFMSHRGLFERVQ